MFQDIPSWVNRRVSCSSCNSCTTPFCLSLTDQVCSDLHLLTLIKWGSVSSAHNRRCESRYPHNMSTILRLPRIYWVNFPTWSKALDGTHYENQRSILLRYWASFDAIFSHSICSSGGRRWLLVGPKLLEAVSPDDLLTDWLITKNPAYSETLGT